MIGSLFGFVIGIALLVLAIFDVDPMIWMVAIGWIGIAIAHSIINLRDEDTRKRRSVGGCGAGFCGGGGGDGGGGCGGGCGGD